MKIRIGNDIKLNVKLTFAGQQTVNIQSMKAVIINSSMEEEKQKEYKNKMRFVGRFPVEPFLDEYTPNMYNINCSGYPGYFATVANKYFGFGINPSWQNILPKVEPNVTEYIAEVERTQDPDIVNITFPASAQLFTGVYKLVIVANIYHSGYSPSNIQVISKDYNDVFELVDNSQEQDPGFDGTIVIRDGYIIEENSQEK